MLMAWKRSLELSFDSGRRYARQLAHGECRLGKFLLQSELGRALLVTCFVPGILNWNAPSLLKSTGRQLANEEETNRFMQEARSVAQLQHPGIISLYEIGQTERGCCYSSPSSLKGQTLESKLKTGCTTVTQHN